MQTAAAQPGLKTGLLIQLLLVITTWERLFASCFYLSWCCNPFHHSSNFKRCHPRCKDIFALQGSESRISNVNRNVKFHPRAFQSHSEMFPTEHHLIQTSTSEIKRSQSKPGKRERTRSQMSPVFTHDRAINYTTSATKTGLIHNATSASWLLICLWRAEISLLMRKMAPLL